MTGESSSNLWLFLEMIARRRGLVLTLVILATLAAVVVSFLLPSWYSSTALLLPPPDESARGGLSQLTDVAMFTGGVRLPGLVTPNDVYARMLGSRRVCDRIIEKFDLYSRYEVTGTTAVYDALRLHTSIKVSDEGILSLTVEDRNPDTAAAMATAYVRELIELNRQILSSTARDKKVFIEARLGEIKGQLDSARKALENFQLDNRTVNLDEQTRLSISQAVDLKVDQANLQLDIAMREKTLGRDHPDLVEKQRRLELISGQLASLEWGDNKDSSFFSVPLSAVPGLRGRYESLYARVQVNESLYETLLAMYEQARIQEQEDSPTIAVLDWPSVPDLRSRPKRGIVVLTTFLLSALLSVFLAAWLEYVRRLKTERVEDYRRLTFFVQAFFGWLPGAGKKRSAE